MLGHKPFEIFVALGQGQLLKEITQVGVEARSAEKDRIIIDIPGSDFVSADILITTFDKKFYLSADCPFSIGQYPPRMHEYA